MSDNSALVFVQIDGQDIFVGTLWSHGQGTRESATFAYDSEYLGRSGSFAIDPALPLTSGSAYTRTGQPIFGSFTDCAPDGWGRRLIRRAGRRGVGRQASGLREFDYLLGTCDDMRQGALRFRLTSVGAFVADADQQIPPLVELGRLLGASERLDREDPSDDDLRILLRAGSSLGGARPKAQVIDVSGRLSIAKFPRVGRDDWPVTTWEAVTQRLAATAGLTVTPSRLERIDGKDVFITERFDRDNGRRIPYMSAMTALEMSDGQPGDYLDVAGVIERKADLEQMWRRIAFSVLISNTDDHLRNHGFLRLGDDGWYLSPAFDINPNPEGRLFSTALAGDDGGSVESLVDCAAEFRLTRPSALNVLAEVLAAILQWQTVARQHGMAAQDLTFMAPAFEHGALAEAKRLVGG